MKYSQTAQLASYERACVMTTGGIVA